MSCFCTCFSAKFAQVFSKIIVKCSAHFIEPIKSSQTKMFQKVSGRNQIQCFHFLRGLHITIHFFDIPPNRPCYVASRSTHPLENYVTFRVTRTPAIDVNILCRHIISMLILLMSIINQNLSKSSNRFYKPNSNCMSVQKRIEKLDDRKRADFRVQECHSD